MSSAHRVLVGTAGGFSPARGGFSSSPWAQDGLSIDEDGNTRYRLRRPDRHGRTTLVMHPHALMARMTALVPRRGWH